MYRVAIHRRSGDSAVGITPQLVMAAGWARAVAQAGDIAEISDGIESITVALGYGGWDIQTATFFPPGWMGRAVHLLSQAADTEETQTA